MDARFFESLEAKTSVLLLIDYQARMFWGASAIDPTYVKNNVLALAQGAKVLGIPTVLTTINAKNNGEFLPEIVAMFPDSPAIDRKIPSLTPSRTRTSLTPSKKPGGNSSCSRACGRACAWLSRPCAAYAKALTFSG